MNNVAEIRKLRGMTQKELAERAGVKQPHISRIEKGDEGPPLSLFRTIASALDVDLADLFDSEASRAKLILLDAFNRLPEDRRKGWLDMAQAALQDQQPDSQ